LFTPEAVERVKSNRERLGDSIHDDGAWIPGVYSTMVLLLAFAIAKLPLESNATDVGVKI
jgi:hypothetical protein